MYGEELKALSGSAAKKYRKEYSAELTEYGQIRTKVLELYPSGHIPTVESLDKKINALIQERSLKDQQFREADKRARDLADAQRTMRSFSVRNAMNSSKNASVKRMGIWSDYIIEGSAPYQVWTSLSGLWSTIQAIPKTYLFV